MASRSGDSTSHIGAVLKQERTRQGLDLGTSRSARRSASKYLRALENEEWDVLPGPAYVRGFLRTYAGELGLDAEELVDDYRSAYEEPDRAGDSAVADPLLGGRTARERPRIDRRIIVVGLIVAVACCSLVLGLTERLRRARGAAATARKRHGAAKQGAAQAAQAAAFPTPSSSSSSARSDSEVCLVNKGGAVLIDNQVLSAATRRASRPTRSRSASWSES